MVGLRSGAPGLRWIGVAPGLEDAIHDSGGATLPQDLYEAQQGPSPATSKSECYYSTMQPIVNHLTVHNTACSDFLHVREENILLQKRAPMNGEETPWKSGVEYYPSRDKRKNEDEKFFQRRCLTEETGNQLNFRKKPEGMVSIGCLARPVYTGSHTQDGGCVACWEM
ncbi:hypothetical protein NDU88_006802 [Pleurodeles waltl]|uniref:Uncharacterized protein n=1 Tax=Pleurodeles waltl TaxID=8319 RepID=A0AAV7RRA4_PLEWA|nr:hypothetical protein NDU88_006802 [Pleurodeles waltl]